MKTTFRLSTGFLAVGCSSLADGHTPSERIASKPAREIFRSNIRPTKPICVYKPYTFPPDTFGRWAIKSRDVVVWLDALSVPTRGEVVTCGRTLTRFEEHFKFYGWA
jgi:hypothetical protein